MDSAYGQSAGVVIPLLGRPLTPTEAALAAAKPIFSLPLSRTLLIALARIGCKSVADVLKACYSGGSFGPVRGRKIRRAILAALGSDSPVPAPSPLNDASLAELRARIEGLLADLDERRRTIVRLKYGLWDGRRTGHFQIAAHVSLDYRSTQAELFSAHGDLRRLLRVKSDDFRDTLRSLYQQLLAAKQGMAGIHEWEEPESLLYKGQAESCMGFAFLCRLSRVAPERLVTMGLNGICYDTLRTNSRHDEVVDAMKRALVNAERPVAFTQMRGWLSRIEKSEEFLRRCVEVSREIGFMGSGMIGLRNCAYFEAHSLHAMARAALVAIGEPAHYARITREIERLYPERVPLKSQSVLHALVTHREEFALAKHGGVYGLSEWPDRAVGSLKDLLADFLRLKGGKASRQDLMSAAQEKGYKTGSVSTILHMHRELFRHAARGQWALAA